MKFYDLDHQRRFEIRGGIEALDCDLRWYNADGTITISMTNDHAKACALDLLLAGYDWEVVDECLFPLGSDKPPQHQRHRCSYQTLQDDPGNWRLRKFAHSSDILQPDWDRGVSAGDIASH